MANAVVHSFAIGVVRGSVLRLMGVDSSLIFHPGPFSYYESGPFLFRIMRKGAIDELVQVL